MFVNSISANSNDYPPPMPYSIRFCSHNTYTVADRSPVKICGVILRELSKINVYTNTDINTNTWNMHYVFYPNETRTSFIVNMFQYVQDTEKDVHLVELQMIEGDRFAFEHMCLHISTVTQLHPVFNGKFMDVNTDEKPIKTTNDAHQPYQHAEWKPLPLPANIACIPFVSVTKDAAVVLKSPSPHYLIQLGVQDTLSPYHNIQRNGWRCLAKITGRSSFDARTLLNLRTDEKTILDRIASVLTSGTNDKTDCYNMKDYIRRQALKTLDNLVKVATSAELVSFYALRVLICNIAQKEQRCRHLSDIHVITSSILCTLHIASGDHRTTVPNLCTKT